MSRLKAFASTSAFESHITAAPDITWSPIGPGKNYLLKEIEKFYWEGVKVELENILQTLSSWKKLEAEGVTVDDEDEDNDHIHGFDTFLDQVCQESRVFAIRHGQRKESEESFQENKNYRQAIQEVIQDRKAEYASSKIKAGVRTAMKDPIALKGNQKRAWMLLQAAVALSKFDEFWLPRFEPLSCMSPGCKNVIRGSIDEDLFVKSYKHCAISEAITPAVSRKLCHCKDVLHFDEAGDPLALLPVDKTAQHLDVNGVGSIRCSLLKLGEVVAMSKFNGLQAATGLKKPSKVQSMVSKLAQRKNKVLIDDQSPEIPRLPSGKMKKMKMVTTTSIHDPHNRSAVSSTTSVVTEAEADQDIPLFFRRYAEKYPFGNVHMALRVGPLVFENGVSHTKKGVRISIREMPIFHEKFYLHNTPDRIIAVGGVDRNLWTRRRDADEPKRYKAIMKQVAGVPFSGVLPTDDELEIVKGILAASEESLNDSDLPVHEQKRHMNSLLDPILNKLKLLIGSRTRIYLQSIATRLLDPSTKLTWSAMQNNCQTFCNSLIDLKLFEPLVNGRRNNAEDIDDNRLYVMSFVCPDDGYIKRKVTSKYDVPNGLTEEYLLRFHFGRYDDADILDSYQEYWWDWGAFGGTLYPYQDLFPWDCTEAYGRYPTKCGDCNLAKHIWAFPFDSWSMTGLHLSRNRHMYAPDEAISPSRTSDSPKAWMQNRLRVLEASSILYRGALAMARTESFCKATEWLHKKSKLRRLVPSLPRVKLGGIHRAQPFSHHFEAGTYSHYFTAPWAIWTREEQIKEYEELRDGRVRLSDVPKSLGNGHFDQEDEEEANRGGREGFWGFGTSQPATVGDYAEVNMMESDAMADAGFEAGNTGHDADGHSACGTADGANCGAGCGNSACGGAACGGDGGDGGGGGGGCGGGGCGGGCGGD
ncbi:hypothetical protein G7Z17_g1717 [Cylindrodendrum hubeiense]|uniref:Uncharacterized protein n=1 Tax=Cylindrodendrum hubeiense TaxID=595255 RepID=A0A9P5HE80_9HYPO|nr:hypothetical protein G7Z17_g1717 [Cylindrodendrum hubeiense]